MTAQGRLTAQRTSTAADPPLRRLATSLPAALFLRTTPPPGKHVVTCY